MDEDSRELVKAATEGGVKAFLDAIIGSVVELGAWGADVVRRQRFKTQVKTLRMADRMLQDAGLSAQAVPAKVLVPLLELAGLEEDHESMSTRWAALLANAAASDGAGASVMPSFPQILAQLSAPEAAMLDWLAALPGGANLDSFMEVAGYDPYATASSRPRDRRYPVYVDNLERLGLCSIERPNHTLREIADRVGVRRPMTLSDRVVITALGAASSPPARRRPSRAWIGIDPRGR